MMMMVLCLFGLYLVQAAVPKKRKKAPVQDEKVYLLHADELFYDIYGPHPDAQIAKGHVAFRHQGATLHCDSAYFYRESNSVSAFGRVKFRQGDTLSLSCDRAHYDGVDQLMEARHHVVLKHRKQTLYTDSLNYDRLYGYAYFFEGGKLVDEKDQLVSDWGEYWTETREANFYFNVRLRSTDRLISTDTLHYDTRASMAHVTGPSKVESKTSTIETEDGYFNTKTDQARMFGRSTIVDQQKTITGDTLFYDDKTGQSNGYGDVIYVDKENKNELHCEVMAYNEKTGYGYATGRTLAMDYSQGDTLYVHSDSMKIYTYNINTDSVIRNVHCFDHVRAYRSDIQAMCDSLVFTSADSCMTMYRDPIVWNANRQIIGEVIKVYMNDSTIRFAHVHNQALSVERIDDKEHYNQISSRDMYAYFVDGALRKTECVGNVKVIFYPTDDKDSTLIGHNYLETDTMRMYLTPERQLDRIWVPRNTGVATPMTQIPPSKLHLEEFAWFEKQRPVDKDDIFVWRGKGEGNELKKIERHDAPLQHLR